MSVSKAKFRPLWLLWAAALQAQNGPHDLIRQSVEDLMNIEVTSVSKKEQKMSQAAAAVYVITQEDIRRSGRPRYRKFYAWRRASMWHG